MGDMEDFIRIRSTEAELEYVNAVIGGATHLAASQQANAVLYKDLRFSKFEAIYEIVADWFPEVAPENRLRFCYDMIGKCDDIFSRYTFTDDFESTPEYPKLQLELTGIIQYHLENEF